MNTCYIFGAAPLEDYTHIRPEIKKGDVIICADGGYTHAQNCGLTPDWVVGDFDSEKSQSMISDVICVKPEKDDTDMQLAVAQGRKLGFKNFVIYGALGGRFDHTMANLHLLVEQMEQGIQMKLVDSRNEIIAIKNTTLTLTANEYPYVSILSFSEKSIGVTLCGMKYPLTEYTLTNRSGGLGVSNEIVDKTASITVKDGTLLVMRTKDSV